MTTSTSTSTSTSESPFIADTKIQYAWDSTSLGYFKTCPRLYQYTILDGWTTKEESVHLRFGREYQKALENYDIERANGINHEDALFDVVKELHASSWDFDSEHRTKTRLNLIRSVIWYLDDHKDDKAQTYILANGKPAVELSFRFELDWGPRGDARYILSGHLDRVIDFTGDLYVLDNKTVYSFWGMEWEPDNQMTLYTLASKIVLGTTVRGVIVDMVLNKDSATEFKRIITHRTDEQLEEWLRDLHYWFALAREYAEQGYWPMNDTSCGKYGGCRFRDICSKSPSVRGRFLESNFHKLPPEERWNPLRPR